MLPWSEKSLSDETGCKVGTKRRIMVSLLQYTILVPDLGSMTGKTCIMPIYGSKKRPITTPVIRNGL